MSELDKLEQYLKEHGYKYERRDEEASEETKEWYLNWNGQGSRHQIFVFNDDGAIVWDAICHWGSYGYERGLLEIMGSIVRGEAGEVEGWLTAQEIIDRLEGKE